MKKFFCLLSLVFFVVSAVAQEEKDSSPSTPNHSGAEVVNDVKYTSIGQYIAGGIVGSAVGYGIGHAIQGRYSDKGWIFTAGEVAGTLVLISGMRTCTTYNFFEFRNCDQGQINLGFGIFLGFHIWEIVDVWTGARPRSSEDSPSTYFVPTSQGGQVAWIYRF